MDYNAKQIISSFKKLLDSRKASGVNFQHWDAGQEWQHEVNKEPTNKIMNWRFDCNFKLDYDGDLVSISSRFWPPHKHREGVPGYQGTVDLLIWGQSGIKSRHIIEKEFECETLDQLVKEVEEYSAKGVL